MTDNYSFQLSFAEFYWLTRAFGLNSLPLLENTQRISNLISSVALSEAQASLQARGFIQKNGIANWQIDRLPAAIIRWLGETEWILSVQHCAHDDSQRRATFFIKEETGLAMIGETNGYCFTVYPDRAALIENLIDWLAIPFPKKMHTLPAYSIPQPEEIISIAWKDSVRATKAFRITHITPRQLKSTLAWIETLQWFASITHIQLSNQITHSTSSGAMSEVENKSKPGTFSLRKTTQVIVCGDKKNIWGASGAANSAEVFSLLSVDRKDLSTQMLNLL